MNESEYRKIKVSEQLDTCGEKIQILPLYKLFNDNELEQKEEEK